MARQERDSQHGHWAPVAASLGLARALTRAIEELPTASTPARPGSTVGRRRAGRGRGLRAVRARVPVARASGVPGVWWRIRLMRVELASVGGPEAAWRAGVEPLPA
jgi:hypothetical protein